MEELNGDGCREDAHRNSGLRMMNHALKNISCMIHIYKWDYMAERDEKGYINVV
jgi:hypothetical protein